MLRFNSSQKSTEVQQADVTAYRSSTGKMVTCNMLLSSSQNNILQIIILLLAQL